MVVVRLIFHSNFLEFIRYHESLTLRLFFFFLKNGGFDVFFAFFQYSYWHKVTIMINNDWETFIFLEGVLSFNVMNCNKIEEYLLPIKFC